jgi:Phage Terminase
VPLMPWQRQVLDVGLEYEPDKDWPNGRRYVYREIDFGTPRQSGKSVLMLVKTLHRMVLCGPGQRSAYSMQSGSAAATKMLDDWVPLIEESDFRHALANVRRSVGSQSLRFKNNSTINIMANTKDSGHGRTLDEAMLDEAFADVDDRREQAVLPAMITRRNAQVWITSTAGTDESLFWRRKVNLGREIAGRGDTSGLAYFEWSAPDGCDPYDEDVWWETMPALGFTQPIEAVRYMAQTMGEDEFCRAMLNMWTRTDQSVIDWAKWVECRNPQTTIAADHVLAVDINQSRNGASICAASLGEVTFDNEGVLVARPSLELVDKHDGIEWVVPRLCELRDRHFPSKVIVDGNGPIAAVIPELERNGFVLTVVGGNKLAAACGAFYDHVMSGNLDVLPDDRLDDAVALAAKRIRGDAFVWKRATTTADISPLYCATLALWGVVGEPNHGQVWIW